MKKIWFFLLIFLPLTGFADGGVSVVAGTASGSVPRTANQVLNMRDFASCNGTDEHVAIQAAVTAAAGKSIFVPPGNCGIGATTITLPSNLQLVGAGRGAVSFTYSGTGVALDGYGQGNLNLSSFSVYTSDIAATGMRFGGTGQHIALNDIAIYGNTTAKNTGTGLLLESEHVGTAFSGNLSANLFYVLGYKFGVRFLGDAAISNRTWTTTSFQQSYILGRAAGIIPGSRGFSVDSLTALTGASFLGGTVEGYETGLVVEKSAYNTNTGIEWTSDIENCTVPYQVGSNFHGQINLSPAASRYRALSNGTDNIWTREKNLNGIDTSESYYSKNFIVKMENGPSEQGFNVYMGASLIGGGSPKYLFGVRTVGTFANPEQTYMLFGTHKTSWGAAAPVAGTWSVGDIVWKTNATAGGSPGWMCVTAGTPGVWKAMASLAP